MSNGIVITSVKDIRLDRHGVIEAHAGTGKTYTIVNLVLEILTRPPSGENGGFIHLREILLVTFTEKAAGELKKRIYDGIVSLKNESSDERLAAHLENCLNNMHEALIGTIHAVCLRMLQTWPFETGVHFNTQIADDEEGVRLTLRESMRTDWQDESTGIPQALAALEAFGEMVEEKHLDLIRQSARKLLCGDTEIDTALESKPIYAVIHRAARALAARYVCSKRQNGLVSYDDMLRLTHKAVSDSDGVMLKTLRLRLRYGIIDEFQDTSPVQWSIFKTIFLSETARLGPNGTVMYIVGDPKQSIYSFQNADVNSYIEAKSEISKRGGVVYSLRHNYRSLPEMIDGYNAVLDCDGASDWFLFDGNGGISYKPCERALPPVREKPKYPLPCKAVQVVPMNAGKVGENREAMAAAACSVIKKLRGTAISLPNGLNFENVTLDYRDFAVIVETNSMADPFIDEFRANGIPCMKYKLRGVFKSAPARDLIALLTAIVKRRSPAHRAAMLLTHFFNRPPGAIDPQKDLTRCANVFCEGDDLCAAHALDHWGKLADGRQWAQLFESIAKRTKIRQRLIRLFDGERKLADLRQVTDFCVEYLYRENSNLEHLVDRLERMYDGDENAGQDKNIYMMSTEKSSVTILTMHAAKGLEFPVVFIMNRNTVRLQNGPSLLSWTDSDKKRWFSPYLSIAQKSEERKTYLAEQAELCERDQRRERRRLLYVAMTRAQALLFVPLHEKENDLTPSLNALLKNGNGNIEIFDEKTFGAGGAIDISTKSDCIDTRSPQSKSLQLTDIPELTLKKFICRETSYTQISGILKGRSRASAAGSDAGEPLPINEDHVNDINTENTGGLPGGRLTGIALHKAIETILKANDINALLNDTDGLDRITGSCLAQNGVLDRPSVHDPGALTRIASTMIKTALLAAYDIGAAVSSLPRRDRIPEAEFLFSAAPHRVCGSMDLLLRVPNVAYAAHPYRYHFIDWKSDILNSYDEASLRKHCADNNYDLQSKFYAAALDKYLHGILGDIYARDENLGNSVYVFLRGSGAFISNDLRQYAPDNADIGVTLNECFGLQVPQARPPQY